MAHRAGTCRSVRVWSYAGADPGVLFRSENWGKSWEEVINAFNRHKTRSKWAPGGGGMRILHSIQCLSRTRWS